MNVSSKTSEDVFWHVIRHTVDSVHVYALSRQRPSIMDHVERTVHNVRFSLVLSPIQNAVAEHK